MSPGEGRERGPVFGSTLDAFERTLGPQVKSLPAEVTEAWIERELKDIVRDQRIDTYNEQTRYNELLYRRAALQRLKELQASQQGNRAMDSVKLKELIVAEQAVTYHEYFREAQGQVLAVLRRYEALRAGVSTVPQEILQMEADTRRYVAALQEATQERVMFSNVLLLDQHIAEGFGDRAASMRLREQYVSQLSPISRTVLSGTHEQKLIRANQLNQRIIDILAGEHGLQGIETGYVPKKMILAFLKFRYKQLLDQQNEIARDPALASARAEKDRLELKFKMAEGGKGEFTSEDKSRYEALQERIKGVNAQYDVLKEKRRGATQEIVTLTQDLGEYNIAQTELSAIQEQFGRKFSFEGVGGISPLTTPPEVRDAIAANMEMRKAHHLGQMGNFLEKVEKGLLEPGLKEKLEDLWNKNGREAVRQVTHRLADFFTFAVPEKFGMRDAAKDALTEPLDEALGWPAGKEKWEELTEKEKQTVREKATSILDLIEKFDRTKIQNFHQTITLIQGMKPASTFALEQVPFDEAGQAILPQERVTSGNINELTNTHGGAVTYLMLMRQLQVDFGTHQPPEAFMGEYAKFLEGVNKNIDVHVDVGRACNILGKRFSDLMKWLLIAAGIGLVIGIIGTVVVLKIGGKSARAVGSGLWRGARGLARLPGRLLRSSGAGAAGGAAAAEAPAAAAEKALEGASKASRVGKVLGPLAIVLVAADLRRVILRDARLQVPAEYEGIAAAIEFMEGHPNMRREDPRYRREVLYLQHRLQCFVMQDGSEKLTQAIERAKRTVQDTALLARAKSIQDRCEAVRRNARQQKMRYERLFPITDYLVTDPRRPAGNIGVNFRKLNEARHRGVEEEEQQRRFEGFRQFAPPQPERDQPRELEDYDELNRAYQTLLEDGAELLEKFEQEKGR